MANACGALPRTPRNPRAPTRSLSCANPALRTQPIAGVASTASVSVDLNERELRKRIAVAGATADDLVYGYVIRTIKPDSKGGFKQTGSAPNWQGDSLTLCTCKHEMRTYFSPEAWKGKWIAGLCGWTKEFNKQQALVILMRVGETYPSQAHLVHALRQMGRQHVVDAKDSRKHALGDLMIPLGEGIPANPHDPRAYHSPIRGHAHSDDDDPDQWHNDVNHAGSSGRQAAMLAGDAAFSFRWTRPMVRRSRPGETRPCRIWTMADFLDDIEGVPT